MFCKNVCPWVIKQSKQISTWRGLLLAGGAIVATVNPALGAAIIKAVGVAVGVIDVVHDETKAGK